MGSCASVATSCVENGGNQCTHVPRVENTLAWLSNSCACHRRGGVWSTSRTHVNNKRADTSCRATGPGYGASGTSSELRTHQNSGHNSRRSSKNRARHVASDLVCGITIPACFGSGKSQLAKVYSSKRCGQAATATTASTATSLSGSMSCSGARSLRSDKTYRTRFRSKVSKKTPESETQRSEQCQE